MELVQGADVTIANAKKILKISDEKAKKMKAQDWLKLINKNPEAFKVSREHITRINTLIKKSNVIMEKETNSNSNNPVKTGRPKSEVTQDIFNFINERINSDWLLIKTLKAEIAIKFEITSAKVESEYTKFSEANGDFIERAFIKPTGWCIKTKANIIKHDKEETNISKDNITHEIKKENDENENEDDPW